MNNQIQASVARALLIWLNQYPSFPDHIGKIEMQFLGKSNSIALFFDDSNNKIRWFINGVRQISFPFALMLRTAPANSAQRLDAVETLDAIAAWAENRADLPELGAGLCALSVERRSCAGMSDRRDDGCEDFQVLMTLTYQVQ